MLPDSGLQLVCRCLNIRIKALSDPVPPPPLPLTESAAIGVMSNNNLGPDPRLELLPEVPIQSLKLSQDEAQDPFFSTVAASATAAAESTTTGTLSTVTPTSVSTPVISSPAATAVVAKNTDEKHVSCHRLVSVVPAVGGEQLPMARNYATEVSDSTVFFSI